MQIGTVGHYWELGISRKPVVDGMPAFVLYMSKPAVKTALGE
jgi:hypothetical protein